jgi:hypothetical protein
MEFFAEIQVRSSTMMPRAATSKELQARVKGIIKAELARRNLTYKDLAERLQAMGVKDNERNISNKLSRGTFTAAFFIQCMDAIGVSNVQLNSD